MSTLWLSNTDLFLANFLWMWGSPLSIVPLFAGALLAHFGDEYLNGEPG